MKLVYVCREFGPVTGGGIGTYIYNVCSSMVQLGHTVYLLTDCFHDENMNMLPEGVKLVRTQASLSLRKGNFVSFHHEYSYQVLETLRTLIAKEHLDIIEFAEFGVEGFASIRAKRLFNEFPETKLIIKLHTPSSLLYHINEDKRLYPDISCDCMMEDYCVQHADMVTSPSLSLADYFKERVGRGDIAQCPYPMDLPGQTGARTFSKEQVKRVRFIGSVQVRKGLDTFIEAAKIILAEQPDFVFEIWGADRNAALFGKSYIDILKRSIPVAIAEKIIFCGGIPYSEIPALFEDSCFCVYPSRWENWANVCLEAMSFGCVVIASEKGGMGEMIEHGTSGFVVDPLNPQDIVTAILDNFENVDTLQQISLAAQKRSREICEPESTSHRIENNYLKPWSQKAWQEIDGDKAPKVSVIIPYYNQPQYLLETVESVQQSNYSSLEIIVVNDGSTSPEALDAFDKLEGVVKVQKQNGGLSSARNAGVEAACGAYILPLDADDTIHPEYIRLAVTALTNNPELDYVSCHARNFGAFEGAYIPVGYVPEMMLFINTHGKCTNLFRKAVFEKCGGYDEVMNSYEDWDFLITLHENGCKGDVLPDELFNYRRHYDSMVYTTANRNRADLIQYMLMKHEKALEQEAPKMAILLSRLWKDTEMQHEFSLQQIANQTLLPDRMGELEIGFQTRLQVYSRRNGMYEEHNSVFVDYPGNRWVNLKINLPFAGQDGSFRLDPANSQGVILMKSVRLLSKSSGQPLWQADAGNNFQGCEAQGEDTFERHGSCLLIHAKTDDPQIILPEIPEKDQSVLLEVSLYFSDSIPEDLDTLCRHDSAVNPVKKILGKFAKQISKSK